MTLTVITAYTQQTNCTGYVTLHLALQPGDTSANTYEVMAMFNGTNPRSCSINASDPYGDQYAVCTTNQHDLRPSTNFNALGSLADDWCENDVKNTKARCPVFTTLKYLSQI
jgi:hypothetical protein